ncbi:MAG: phosphotransferase family protein [Acidimicrobiales bacterium]
MSMLDTQTMPAKIEQWLAANVAPAKVNAYEIMTGGFSRVMAKVSVEWADGSTETFVLRGDPPPEIATLASDRRIEWELLSDLCTNTRVPIPAARWFVSDESLFGSKAIFIDHVDGGSLQASLDGGFDQGSSVESLVAMLANISQVTADQVPSLEQPSSWESHIDSLISRWDAVADRHSESLPIVRYIAAWLDRRRPAPAPLTLVHGDFQQGNVVDNPDGWLMVDWEFSRIGDPREDLGYYNAYATSVPPSLIEPDTEAFLAAYRAATGLSEEQVNPVTLGYFTVLSTIGTLDSLYDGLDGMIRGERHGVAVAYNSQLIPVGNDNFVNAIDGLEAALAAAEG